MDSPSYFSILPATVRFDKNLTDFEKLLFAEITSLSNTWGYCTASNKYLADLYDKKPETVSRSLSRLNSKDYIEIYFHENDSAQRRIFPLVDAKSNHKAIDKKIKGGLTKMSRGVDENVKGGVDENVKYNSNIESNNKTNIKKGENKEVFTPPQRDEVLTVYAQIFTDSKVKNARAWADWEATKFFDHYTANGWKVGGKGRLTPMKSWQQAATRWARKCIEDGISDKRLPDKYAATSTAPDDFPKQKVLNFN